jgi:hypothetical protein
MNASGGDSSEKADRLKFLQSFIDGQGRDITRECDAQTNFKAIETMSVPGAENSLEQLKWAELDQWHADRDLVGWPYQYSTFASPAGGYTSFHTDHHLMGYRP